MRRLLRILVAGSILGALPSQGAELRIGLAADVTSMDPHFLNIAPNINIAWHVFDALTHVDEDARLIPGLAVSWRAIDPTTWEFRLRRGVRFHDGAELTAEDVAFSIERTFKVPNGQFRTFTQRIVGKQILDAHTLRLKTAAPYAMVPYDLNSVF
ncbi:MAG: ABC transporter substrate-binding protein, partial [Betaproteobacteria bacterium]